MADIGYIVKCECISAVQEEFKYFLQSFISSDNELADLTDTSFDYRHGSDMK